MGPGDAVAQRADEYFGRRIQWYPSMEAATGKPVREPGPGGVMTPRTPYRVRG